MKIGLHGKILKTKNIIMSDKYIMNDIHIVTVATESKYYFPYLIESCKKNGKEVEVLGFGEKWKGFNFKFKLMIDYLRRLPENDIVCYIDGYDSICSRELRSLKTTFLELKQKHGCKIIVGEDQTSFLVGILNRIYFNSCNDKRLNAGAYMGQTKDILEMLQDIQKINSNDDADDQQLLIEYCRKTKNDIYCDTEHKLFVSLLYPLEEIDKYIKKDENPFFIHAVGYGYLENVIIKLGYSIDPNKIKNELYNNFIEKKVFLYTYNVLKNNMVLLTLLFILFFVLFFIMKRSNSTFFYKLNKPNKKNLSL